MPAPLKKTAYRGINKEVCARYLPFDGANRVDFPINVSHHSSSNSQTHGIRMIQYGLERLKKKRHKAKKANENNLQNAHIST